MPVQAKRRSVPFEANAKELADLQVAVYVGSKATNQQTRGARLHVYKPVVTVAKRLKHNDDERQTGEADELLDLVAAIETAVGVDLAGCSFQKFDEESDRDIYNVDALRFTGCFAVPIGLEFWGP